MIHTTHIQMANGVLSLTTGELANLTESAIKAQMGGTVVLVTIATQKLPHPMRNMVPLSVHYSAPFYAAGKFPGGFNKRETKPSEQEVTEARLIDRAIRPLFPDGFDQEIQVMVECLSYDGIHEPSSFTITATSAALRLSSLPFKEAIAAVSVGEFSDTSEGRWTLNPSFQQMSHSLLDLVVAGSRNNIMMVECGAHERSEADILSALQWGHQQIRSIIDQVEAWTQSIAQPTKNVTGTPLKHELSIRQWLEAFMPALRTALSHEGKRARLKAVSALVSEIESQAKPHLEGWELSDTIEVTELFRTMQYAYCRQRILRDGQRVDGRDTKTVRPISIQTRWLPHTHGSSVFTRGETQAMVVTTLGGDRDAQSVDGIHGDLKERFMLHYSFPHYSVGECGMVGAPKRREIGHGRLARRALMPLLPHEDDFPYVIRVASKIASCNGSSSMATVCGASLALFDAGVPMKAPVAGIAMGLITEGDQYVVLSDILGDEDAYGDMDFKVAGTSKGITALQMDIKVDGVSEEILAQALTQAREGRLHILEQMNAALAQPRPEVSEHAPKVIIFNIKTDKIREVIGKGGSVIKELCERYQITIDISEAGQVKIGATSGIRGEEAKQHILSIVKEAEPGEVYQGSVSKILEFGAFVTILPGKDGFLHISEISEQRIANINDHLKRGQTVRVKVLEIDAQGRVRLTMRNIDTYMA